MIIINIINIRWVIFFVLIFTPTNNSHLSNCSEAEPTIKTSEYAWEEYSKYFNI